MFWIKFYIAIECTLSRVYRYQKQSHSFYKGFMMEWTVLSKVKHKDIAISQNKNYSFMEKQIFLPICTFELQTAVSYLPIAKIWVRLGEGTITLGMRHFRFARPQMGHRR